MRNIILTLVWLILVGCGTESGNGGSKTQDPDSAPNDENVKGAISIALESKADLPDCTKENDTQLAYIKDEKVFYVCDKEEWAEVEIKGKDGVNGKDAIATATSTPEPTLSANEWKDPISGFIWALGGPSTWHQSEVVCSGSYRFANQTEAYAAINHGILGKAQALNLPQVFWEANGFGAGLSSGVPADLNVQWASGQGAFCIKN